MLNLTFDNHVTGYAAMENMQNYNLLLANWNNLNILVSIKVFRVEKSIGDIRFAVQ